MEGVEEEDPRSRGDGDAYDLYPSNILRHINKTHKQIQLLSFNQGKVLGFAKLFVPILLSRS